MNTVSIDCQLKVITVKANTQVLSTNQCPPVQPGDSTFQVQVSGTGQNQLQYAIQLAESQISAYSAAESRIRDADVAAEAANLTKAQVLQQASLAAMAQANSAPQSVLSLLRQ